MKKNVTASVRQRLLNRSRETGESFQNLLIRYGIERLLYRLSHSEHADEFILKGANLFYVWTGQLYRPTKDVDMLHLGRTDPEFIKAIFESCLAMNIEEDGLIFDEQTIEARTIREIELYSGTRITLKATLGKAQIPLQIDVGVGDAVTPPAEIIEYPSLLDMPAARLRAYRLETAIAEKCEAMVKLGIANTRLKDFYDVFILARGHEFSGEILTSSVLDTFTRRGTPLPTDSPVAWTSDFGNDPQKLSQWRAFLQKSKLTAPDLNTVVSFLNAFLLPVCHAARNESPLQARWSGTWESSPLLEEE